MFYVIFGGIMLILGLLVHKAKLHFLISGYNTYSREKQENVDVESTAKLIGYYGYANAAVFFAAGGLGYFDVKVGLIPPIVFMMISTMILLWKIQKYDRNVFDEDGQMKKSSKVQLFLVLLILGGTFLFVGYMMFASSRDTSVLMDEQGIEIEGMYGDAYEWASMEGLALLSELPDIRMRTNGSAIGSKLRGHFRMEEYGSVKLFMDASVSPFIYFEVEGKPVIFNLGDEEKTEEFFQKMNEMMP
ncbi:DUF3784 domain-containing protein [Proteiniclasticum sp. C24MP]|uniref:DUF3784 domain-containing protein n=1 Tax=Proteiniclasticum sp. C24MP TaxID=3374101 RepID=UPI003754303F